MKRKIYNKILSDLQKKMVFIVGPRQVGKTWLAKEIMKEYKNPVYLNYDNSDHREIIRKEAWLPDVDLIVFDEIHKMPKWKNYLKGVYDTKSSSVHILVTGSARMDAFKKVGDSLAGRFYVHHLFPFTLSELKGSDIENVASLLMERSGFPEPLLASNNEDVNRWRSLYTESLLGQDVLEFQDIDKVNAIRLVYQSLKNKVGSPISYSNIAGDIGISSITVKKYIEILEAIYIIFIIKPYTHKISRSILKEPKIYFFDYALINDVGAKFENFVALALYKHIKLKNDRDGASYSLGFLKTKEKKEVDFALSDSENNLIEIIEAKVSDSSISKTLEYFREKYKVESTQVVYNLQTERVSKSGAKIKNAEKYLENLEEYN
ncbi:MAG: ATP-binding protein [Candidatus Paceibacterota bacterium]